MYFYTPSTSITHFPTYSLFLTVQVKRSSLFLNNLSPSPMSHTNSSLAWKTIGKNTRKCSKCSKTFSKNTAPTSLLNHISKCQQSSIKSTLSTIPLSSGSQLHIEKLIANLICSSVLSFRIVENHHFRTLIKFLQPQHKPISRGTITNRINSIYLKTKSEIKQQLLSTPFKVSLTTDGWTDRTQRQFMSVTAHFITKDYKIVVEKVLAPREVPPPHDANCIATFVESVLSEFDIKTKTLSITTDNASNVVKACQTLDFIQYHVRCFCHVLNLVVRDGLSVFSSLIQTLRKTAVTIKQSATLISQLKNICNANNINFKTVVIDQETRWNSTYNMLTRMAYLKVPLQQLEITSPKPNHVSDYEWNCAAEIIQLLDLLFQYTLEFQSSSTANIGSLHIAYRKVDSHLRSFRSKNNKILESCEVMLRKLQVYYSKQDEFCVVACVLDPRVKLLPFTFTEHSEILSIFNMHLENYSFGETENVDITTSKEDKRLINYSRFTY